MAKRKAAPTQSTAALSKFQTFTVVEVHRRDIKKALYNPRTLDDYSRQKLRSSLETHGLVEPLVWNRRTGNLVGGHQRISQLDDLEGTDDYRLSVSVIDVPLKQEMELNVALNNQLAQGRFDADALIAMLKSDVAPDIEAMGFTMEDLELQFGEMPELRADDDELNEETDAGDRAEDDLEQLRNLKRENRDVNPDLQTNTTFLVQCVDRQDKLNFFAKLGRPSSITVMAIDELLVYLRPESKHREPGTYRARFESITEQVEDARKEDSRKTPKGET